MGFILQESSFVSILWNFIFDTITKKGMNIKSFNVNMNPLREINQK